ncbi:hypothetical protein FHU39_000165 [Flexivirga oryzae]|uniref:Uncharacterized protein n=1 Tax=Flexivirga oryzae TaxID=1794944 RepID=A0A839N605_9MICO|nr:hypothetical protein [Flexivirga oryzae]
MTSGEAPLLPFTSTEVPRDGQSIEDTIAYSMNDVPVDARGVHIGPDWPTRSAVMIHDVTINTVEDGMIP